MTGNAAQSTPGLQRFPTIMTIPPAATQARQHSKHQECLSHLHLELEIVRAALDYDTATEIGV
jgi:hypothetical protein